MITQRFSAEAEEASARYGLVVEVWRSLFRGALDSAAFGSAQQIQAVRDQAYSIARAFLERERVLITERSLSVAQSARQGALSQLGSIDTVELTDAMRAHLGVVEQHLASEIAIQIERDIGALQVALQRTNLQVSIAARAHGVSLRAALVQYRMGNASDLHFFFHDRRNQKFPSRKFVRSVWRHHLLSLYNEVVLLTLSDHGEISAQVRHANRSSEFDGQIVAMSAGSEQPTYAEVRDAVFHPNADAILERVGANVHPQ